MDLKSGYPYWLLKNGLPSTYPPLRDHHSCDVLIVGGGICGVFAAYHLSKEGYHVTVVDRRHFGMGSTCASTSLVQYEIDEHLTDLIEKYGADKAIRSYQLSLEAFNDIESIIKKHNFKCGFIKRPSLYLASLAKDKNRFEKEYDARTSAGFDLKLWDTAKIESLFGFNAPMALWSENSAEMDVLKLTYEMVHYLSKKGVSLYDGTGIKTISTRKNKSVATTESGYKIKAKYVVIACGYESGQFLEKTVSTNNSTYAVISEPVDSSSLWYRSCLIWESARPYLYMRTTSDNRIIVGGKDEPFYNPEKRDRLLNNKSKSLVKAFNIKFPEIQFNPDFKWTGTFAETKDSLPYIDKFKGLFFVLGFGGNGITYSQLAGKHLSDLLKNKKNPDLELFSFRR